MSLIRRRQTPLKRWIIAFSTVFVLVVNALVVLMLWEERQQKLQEAATSAQNLVRTLEEHSVRTFFSVDQLFQDMAYVLSLRPETTVRGAPEIGSYLRYRKETMPQVAGIVIVNRDGLIQHHTVPGPPPDFSVANRDYVAMHRDSPKVGLYIDSPTASHLQPDAKVIPLSRRLERADGSFAGAAVTMVNPAYFEDFYRSVKSGRDTSVLLVRGDGTVLIRELGGPLFTGPSALDTPLFQTFLPQAAEGTHQVTSPTNGAEYLLSYRRVAGYPLVQAIVVSVDEVLAPWRRDIARLGTLAITITISVLALTGVLIARIEREGRAQRELAEASARIQGILNSMVDAVITIDDKGRIQTFNRAAEILFGYEAAEMLGQSVNQLMPDPFRGEHDRYLAEHIRTGRTTVIGRGREVAAVCKDGSTFPAFLSVSRLRLEDGDRPGIIGRIADPERLIFVGVIRDISNWKEAEAELIASKSQAELANRAKSEFLANMSHELRTPLNAIIGFSELLDSEFFGQLNERQKACARDIHDSGQHLLDVINAVLDMSKIEAGRYELVEETVTLAEIADVCLTMVREQAGAGAVTLVNKVPASLPALWGDRRAIKQTMLNLLSNAVKFTPKDGTVTVAAVIEETGGMALSISDTGIGIAKDMIGRIFEPFRQADASTTRQFEGTGLGLSISRNFIELHGGSIAIQSELGQGTTITAHLPASRVMRLTDLEPAGLDEPVA